MAENLNIDHYRNGDPIPQLPDPKEWHHLTSKWYYYDPMELEKMESQEAIDHHLKEYWSPDDAWCYFNNDPKNDENFGKLYNWNAVNDSRGLAPSGWHIPTENDFAILKETILDDPSKFTKILAGYRDNAGGFHHINESAYFWSSTSYNDFKGTYLNILGDYIDIFDGDKGCGYSVRCIKD